MEDQPVSDYLWPTCQGIHTSRFELKSILKETAKWWGMPIESVLNNPKTHLNAQNRNFFFIEAVNAPEDVPMVADIEGRHVSWVDKPNVESEDPDGFVVRAALHEAVMHGGAFSAIDDRLPYVLRDHNIVSAEGFGRLGDILLATDPSWHQNILQVDDQSLSRLKPALLKSRLKILVGFGDDLKRALFIRGLYRNPDQNLDHLLEKVDLNNRMNESNWPERCLFVYNQQWSTNYALAVLWMAQVAETLEERFGGVYTKAAGQALKAHFARGKMYNLQESAIALTGKPLSVEPLRRMIRKTYADLISELKKLIPQNER